MSDEKFSALVKLAESIIVTTMILLTAIIITYIIVTHNVISMDMTIDLTNKVIKFVCDFASANGGK